MSAATSHLDERTFLGHPVALYLLFMTELWERMSFYGMRALLTLFMVKAFMWDDARAAIIYGAYGALVYATPFIGGAIADRVIGYRNAIVLGALIMTLGHFTLGLEPFFEDGTSVFFVALAMLVVGNGFFKPNISTLVGKLYGDEDPRRDGAFTIFYMGINIGAFIAPLVCGTLGEVYGWHYGFGAAGVGMAVGMVCFIALQGMLGEHGLVPDVPAETAHKPWLHRKVIGTWVAAFLAIPVFVGIIRANELLGPWFMQVAGTADILGTALTVVGLITLGYLLVLAFSSDPVQRDRLGVVIVLLFFSLTFWAFFEQAGSSINLFTERNVDTDVMGYLIPTSWGQAINPMFIILFAPLFSSLWLRLGKADADPTPGVKFAMALAQLGLGFGVLWASQFFADANGQVPLLFLLLGYMLHTTGELCLSPVGLSMVTKLSPPKAVGFVMGAWFLATSFSHYIAGAIAALTGGGGHGAHTDPGGGSMETLHSYTAVFGPIAIVSLVAALVCLAISPLLKRWLHGVR